MSARGNIKWFFSMISIFNHFVLWCLSENNPRESSTKNIWDVSDKTPGDLLDVEKKELDVIIWDRRPTQILT